MVSPTIKTFSYRAYRHTEFLTLQSSSTHSRHTTVRGSTWDFKPHRNIWGFGGNDAHHVRYRVAFHYRKREWGLLEEQRSCICRQLRFGDPLDVQATGGGFLRTSVVDGFYLRERQGIKAGVTRCYATLANGSLCSSLVDRLSKTFQKWIHRKVWLWTS